MDGHGGGVPEAPAPHPFQELGPAERLIRVGDQERQQVELADGQRQVAAGHRGPPGADVHLQVPVTECGPRARGRGHVAGPAQHRRDPQHQLAGAERLGDVVVSADLQARDPVLLLPERGQHDDRHLGSDSSGQPELAAHRQPRATGQHQVQHDEVGPLLARQPESRVAVAAGGDPVAGSAQIPADHLPHGRVVVDHEHVSGVRRDRRRSGLLEHIRRLGPTTARAGSAVG
jgi:hypothetical protein